MEKRKASVPFPEIASDRSPGKVTSHVKLQQYAEKFGEKAFTKVFTKNQLQSLCRAYGMKVTTRATKSALTKDLLLLLKESDRMPHPYYTDVLRSRVNINEENQRITLNISRAD